jgi:hypothetical protein
MVTLDGRGVSSLYGGTGVGTGVGVISGGE